MYHFFKGAVLLNDRDSVQVFKNLKLRSDIVIAPEFDILYLLKDGFTPNKIVKGKEVMEHFMCTFSLMPKAMPPQGTKELGAPQGPCHRTW